MKSRLTKIEEKKSLKQAAFLFFLTLIFSFSLIFAGIPLLIKLAIFLGEIRTGKQQIEEITDHSPLAPPILEPLPEATNSSQIIIKGYGQSGTEIELTINQKSVGKVITDKEGKFIFPNVILEKGENQIQAIAISFSGRKTVPSEITKIIFDDEPPLLEIISPSAGSKFFGKNNQVTINGKSEPKIRVYIKEKLIFTDDAGNFSTILPLEQGENQIQIKAIDEANNQTLQTLSLIYIP